MKNKTSQDIKTRFFKHFLYLYIYYFVKCLIYTVLDVLLSYSIYILLNINKLTTRHENKKSDLLCLMAF